MGELPPSLSISIGLPDALLGFGPHSSKRRRVQGHLLHCSGGTQGPSMPSPLIGSLRLLLASSVKGTRHKTTPQEIPNVQGFNTPAMWVRRPDMQESKTQQFPLRNKRGLAFEQGWAHWVAQPAFR